MSDETTDVVEAITAEQTPCKAPADETCPDTGRPCTCIGPKGHEVSDPGSLHGCHCGRQWAPSAVPDVELIKAVRLLQPRAGDIVVFHLAEPLTEQEFDEFNRRLTPLREHAPGVLFMVAEQLDDITVVRPESEDGNE